MPVKSTFNNLEVLPENNVASTLTLYGPSGNFGLVFQGPTGLSSNVTLSFPTGAGSTGQLLASDGAGNLYWTTSAGGTGNTGPTGPAGVGFTGPTGPTGQSPTYVYVKTADQSVTSSTVLVDDTHLTTGATTLGSGYYWIEIKLFVSRADATNSPILKFALSAGSYGYVGMLNMIVSSVAQLSVLADGTTSYQSISMATIDAGVSNPVSIYACLKVTAGNSTAVTLKWAQEASVGTAITVMKGSYMTITKTADL